MTWELLRALRVEVENLTTVDETVRRSDVLCVIADFGAKKFLEETEKTNWTTEEIASPGWAGCPHCRPDFCDIHLPAEVRSDIPVFALPPGEQRLAAPAGVHRAEFNPQGAAVVRVSGGKALGIKPAEFRWLHPVPPYDRWCKGKGGLHQ